MFNYVHAIGGDGKREEHTGEDIHHLPPVNAVLLDSLDRHSHGRDNTPPAVGVAENINLVDEVLQWEIVVTVEGISERFLLPALAEALAQFPFVIKNFHSDNGSEYINKLVAKLLQKLLIDQTKSRSRKTNDNALVEGKNGSVIRPVMGFIHIPKKYAKLINDFDQEYLNPYLNFHRQCAFADEIVDGKGKIKKVYKTYLTPCEKLLAIPEVERYLKTGTTTELLRRQMMRQTHLAAAEEKEKAKEALFAKIHGQMVH